MKFIASEMAAIELGQDKAMLADRGFMSTTSPSNDLRTAKSMVAGHLRTPERRRR
jgi:hypothetical protein